MLAKKYRLPVGGCPNKSKTIFSGDLISAKTTPNNLGYNRLGVVVGRSVVTRATQRNKVKRLVFSFFQDIPNKREKESRDILIVFKSKKRKTLPKDELFEELEKIANELNK